jgi:glutamate/tyrosine decarboxylase-like PLP-dependent enzyme
VAEAHLMSTPHVGDGAADPHINPAYPLAAWFLGPRAENAGVWTELIDHIFQDYVHWRRNYFPADPWIVGRVRRRSPEHESWLDLLTGHLDGILSELKFHFPLHSPRYNAHMVSEQSLPAVLGYFAGLLYNPNNVTDEVAPITVALELEVGRLIATMLGYDPRRSWAHICSGGTLATLEALWVARAVQFAPLIGRDYCRSERLAFRLRLPDGEEAPLTELDDRTLVALRPQEAGMLLRRLAYHLETERQLTTSEALAAVNAAVAGSRFNVARRGLAPILAEAGLRPVVLASAAAHYSIAKAVNVLGYGEDAARLIPVNDRFQMDVGALREAVLRLRPEEYLAAVIGIVGTTEEGAVDPIHRIRALRDECEREQGRSFWIHVDAAWGGYIRTLFNGLPVNPVARGSAPEAVADEYLRILDLHEQFSVDVGLDQPDLRTLEVRWGDRETCAAFLAIADADSTTVDPHKMGYVPYPAGVVAFRNGAVTEVVTQRAQYLSDEMAGVGSFAGGEGVRAFGPHILEGSKPGAAALACWLAHRAIPLTAHGHGKIVRVTLLNARRLARLLTCHEHLFARLERDRAPAPPAPRPFTFFPIAEPDTNLVCFVARPMAWQDGGMVLCEVSLESINRLNERVFSAASIPGSRSHERPSTAQPFFISRTRFEDGQYRAETVGGLLQRLGIPAEEYRSEGLFVLRSTVMNPWHTEARDAGMDYLYEFVRFLHRVTAENVTS